MADAEGEEEVRIPDGIIMQTLPVNLQPQVGSSSSVPSQGWVTSFFGVDDDFKQTVPSVSLLSEISLRGVSMDKILLRGSPETIFKRGETKFGLWNAKIFPFAETPQQSLKLSLEVLHAIVALKQNNNNKEEEEEGRAIVEKNKIPLRDTTPALSGRGGDNYLSWEDALACKDMPRLFARRAQHT